MRLRIESMSSAVKADSLEAALEAAVRRFDGTSPVTPQVHQYLGYAGDTAGARSRSRMRLVLEVVAEEGGAAGDGVDVACAVEILHCSTLVHDSVEDAERSRFGLAHGINAGDALCAMAYLQLLDGPPSREPARTVAMTRALQAANFSLCAGQAQEVAFARDGASGDAGYLAMIEGKAALFAVACELGAFVAGASGERAQAYGTLGRMYGMAFQMEDHVQTDPAARSMTLPPVASLATVRAYLADGDAFAGAHGIDASGRVRAFFTREIRQAA
jgi:geranylgeranyl pyrophosphate synthase